MTWEYSEYQLLVSYIKRRIISFFALVILFAAGAFVMWQQLVVTYVVCDDKSVAVLSYTDDTDLIIGRSGMKVKENNTVVLDYFDPDIKGSIIIITKPHDVLFYDEGKFKKVVTVSGTVGDAVNKSGIKLKDGDKISVNKAVIVSENTRVDINRAFTVTLISDGRKQKLRTVDCTVEEFLRNAGVRVGADDIVTPKLTKKLTKETKVQVKRVTYKEVKKNVAVKFDTKVEYDDSMYEEQYKIKRKGKEGKQINYYKYKYIDGRYVGRTLVKKEITKDPVSKIVVWGSRPSLYGGNVARRVISELTPPFRIDMDENNRPVNYKKKIVGKATAYCTGTVTSTGRRAQPGVVAVDPREIPYGSKLYIVSSDNRYVYGYAIAGDTGGFIYNSDTVVDLYIRGYSAAKQFGRRTVEIYVLE